MCFAFIIIFLYHSKLAKRHVVTEHDKINLNLKNKCIYKCSEKCFEKNSEKNKLTQNHIFAVSASLH